MIVRLAGSPTPGLARTKVTTDYKANFVADLRAADSSAANVGGLFSWDGGN